MVRNILTLMVILLGLRLSVDAQYCATPTSVLPITPSVNQQFTPYYSSGIRVFSFTATAGCFYTFSTCGESNDDTFLRLYNSSLTFIYGNDDICGWQSSFIWLCPANGTYFMHLSRYSCQSLTSSTRVSYLANCGNTSPCASPVVSAGPDISICPGNSVQLAGAVSGISSGGGPITTYAPLVVGFYGWTNLDMLSWTLTNAAGVLIGSGGPYINANTSTTISSPGPGPYSFYFETYGSVCDNSLFYYVSSNGVTLVNGYMDPCNAQNLTLQALNPSSSSLPVTYSWSASPTLSANNILNPIATPTSTTTYTLTASQGTCVSQDQVTVVVYPAPTLSISSAPNTTVLTCNQPSITLTAVGNGTITWLNGSTPIATGNTLTVTTPGTYNASIQNQNSCSTTNSITITQDFAIPVAGITTNPNTNVLNCNTPTIALTGNGGATYSWANGGTIISATNTTTISSPGIYTLTAVGANGCIDTAQINIYQDLTPPIATISSSAASNTLDCNTASITLTAGGGANYSWGNGATALGNANQLFVSSAGTYTLTATGSNGCTDTANITINFLANTTPTFNQIAPICAGTNFSLPQNSLNGVLGSWSPAPDFNTTTTYTFTPNTGICANPVSMTIVVNPYPTLSAQNDTICAGQTGTITTQTNLSGGTYTWAGSLNTASSLSLPLNFSNSFQVTYTVAGCSTSAYASIEVNPIPQLSVQNATICFGQSGTISVVANLPNGTFLWSNGSTASAQVLSPTVTTTYEVIYTLNGCASLPNNATITVLPVPNITVNNPTICLGDPAILIASSNPSGGNFFWGQAITNGSNQLSLSPIQDTLISVYNVLNGCSSDTISAQITVNPLPVSTINASVGQGCVPLEVVFNPDNTTYDSYTWQSNNQNIGTAVPLTYEFFSAGTYNITLTTTLNGCNSTSTLANPILVEAYPIASFEPSSAVFMEQNQGLSFWNNSSAAQSYFWDFGDGATSEEFAPYHLFNNDVNEQLMVTLIASSSLGCNDTATYTIAFDPGLVYYIPNTFTPDGDQENQTFTPIFTYGIDPNNYSLEIYNRWGQLIFESQNPEVGWDGTYSTQGHQCQNGTYTYKITVKVSALDDKRVIVGHVNLIR